MQPFLKELWRLKETLIPISKQKYIPRQRRSLELKLAWIFIPGVSLGCSCCRLLHLVLLLLILLYAPHVRSTQIATCGCRCSWRISSSSCKSALNCPVKPCCEAAFHAVSQHWGKHGELPGQWHRHSVLLAGSVRSHYYQFIGLLWWWKVHPFTWDTWCIFLFLTVFAV